MDVVFGDMEIMCKPVKLVEGKSKKDDVSVRQTEMGQATLKHAYQKNGCILF